MGPPGCEDACYSCSLYSSMPACLSPVSCVVCILLCLHACCLYFVPVSCSKQSVGCRCVPWETWCYHPRGGLPGFRESLCPAGQQPYTAYTAICCICSPCAALCSHCAAICSPCAAECSPYAAKCSPCAADCSPCGRPLTLLWSQMSYYWSPIIPY